jgi:hypothetical protein
MTGIIYMEPLASITGIIFMYPLPLNGRVIYMKPGGMEDADWQFLGSFTWVASLASTTWTEDYGNYGNTKITINGKNEVKIVGISGSYNDNVPLGNIFLGTLGFKTACDFAACGPGGSLEGNYSTFPTADAAEAAWGGATCTLQLGVDGVLAYGMEDSDPANNAGALTFAVYVR